MEKKRIKALLCCSTCSPGRGSEPGMGWNFASAVSSFCEAHIIVFDGYRSTLQAYCAEHPEETKHIHFHFLADEPLSGRWLSPFKKHFPTLYCYYLYNKWLRRATELAQQLDKEENFDLVHQVTMAGFRFPGFLWRLRKPLLWGPIGGLDNAPYRLLISLSPMEIVGYTLRNIINSWQRRFGYAAKVYARHADYILASTKEGERIVRNVWKRHGEYMCEIGTQHATSGSREVPIHRQGTPLRVCWAGIMNNQRKNLPLLFRALEYCESPVEVRVMGCGAMLAFWQKLAQRVPSRHRVTFLGGVVQERVYAEMRSAHVFSITSVKDDTSSVLLEALQHGLPVIAPDSCGFSGVITEECGIKIDIALPETFAENYGRALDSLAKNEDRRIRLAHGATRRAEAYTWEHKTERLKEIYRALASREPL